MGSVLCPIVAQPPSPPSVPPAPGPPTQPPPYPPSTPYPPYPYYPPPRRDNLPLVLIIVLVVLILVPTVFAAILYVMVADLTRPTPERPPQVTLSSVTQDCPAGCSATISVAGVSSTLSAAHFMLNLRAGPRVGTAVAMPATGGGFASVLVEGTSYRVYWTDLSADGHLNPGDAFRVTGNNASLPPSTPFTFYLVWSADGTYIQSASWTTP